MIKRSLTVLPLFGIAVLLILMPTLCAQECRTVRSVLRPFTYRVVPQQVQQVQQQQVCVAGTCAIQESALPTVQVPMAAMTAAAPQPMTALGDGPLFRIALLKAASNQRRAGNITVEQFFELSRYTRNSGRLEELRSAMEDTVVDEGLVSGPATAIDWNGLVAFMEKLIPLILQIISVLGK